MNGTRLYVTGTQERMTGKPTLRATVTWILLYPFNDFPVLRTLLRAASCLTPMVNECCPLPNGNVH